MNFSKNILKIIAGVFLLFTAAVHGGELEKLARELDYIEENYWTIASLPESSELRSDFASRLRTFTSRMAALHRKLKSEDIAGSELLINSSDMLRNIFFSIRPARLPNVRIVTKGTGLGEYSKTFLKNQRMKNRNKKKKDLPSYPTLRNVNQTSYRIWVERICRQNAVNLKKYARRKKRGKTFNHGLARNFESFALAVSGLRSGMVAIAQNPSYKEK